MLLGRACWAAAQHGTAATRATPRRAGRGGVKFLPRGTLKSGQHAGSVLHTGVGGQAPALPRRGVRGSAATGVQDGARYAARAVSPGPATCSVGTGGQSRRKTTSTRR